MIAAFVAAAIALVAAAWFALSAGRDYVAAEERIDALVLGDGVLSDLSSTTGAAQRDDAARVQSRRVAELRDRVRAERATARAQLDTLQRMTMFVGALAVALPCFACAVLLRGMRERERLPERVHDKSQHDALTGLPNRRFFGGWLTYAIAHARRENGRVGVLFIDVGGCAAVAELHGGPAVEALLVEVARRFRAASREGDVFARLGASEFALATPNAHDGRQLALIAQRLRDALNDPALPPLADTPIGASIGIAFFPEDADDSAGIMAAANAAMYAARRAGVNHVAFNALAA